jgi:hypothetical protein
MIPAQQAQESQELEPQLQEPVAVQEFPQQVLKVQMCRVSEQIRPTSNL